MLLTHRLVASNNESIAGRVPGPETENEPLDRRVPTLSFVSGGERLK